VAHRQQASCPHVAGVYAIAARRLGTIWRCRQALKKNLARTGFAARLTFTLQRRKA
jgi:hypothetical protein